MLAAHQIEKERGERRGNPGLTTNRSGMRNELTIVSFQNNENLFPNFLMILIIPSFFPSFFFIPRSLQSCKEPPPRPPGPLAPQANSQKMPNRIQLWRKMLLITSTSMSSHLSTPGMNLYSDPQNSPVSPPLYPPRITKVSSCWADPPEAEWIRPCSGPGQKDISFTAYGNMHIFFGGGIPYHPATPSPPARISRSGPAPPPPPPPCSRR